MKDIMKLWAVVLGFLVGGSVTLGHAPLDSSVSPTKAFNKENGPNLPKRMGKQKEVSQILQPMKYSESNLYKLPTKDEAVGEKGLVDKINTDSADSANSDSSLYQYKSQGPALQTNNQNGHYIFSNGIVKFVAYTTPPSNTVTTTSKATVAYDTFTETISEATTGHAYGSNSTTDSPYNITTRDAYDTVSVSTKTVYDFIMGLESDSVAEDKIMKSTSHATKSSLLTDEFQTFDDSLSTESSVMSVEMPKQTADGNAATSMNYLKHVSTWNLTSLQPLFPQSIWPFQTSPATTKPPPTIERDTEETHSWTALDEGLYVKTTTRRPFTPTKTSSASWPLFDVEGESKRPLEHSAETAAGHSPAGNDYGLGHHDDDLFVETATGKPLMHPVTTTTNAPFLTDVGNWLELEDGLFIRTSTRQPFTRPVKTTGDPSTTVPHSMIPMSGLTSAIPVTVTQPAFAADTVEPSAANVELTSTNLWDKVSQWFSFEKIPNITSTKWAFSHDSAPMDLPSLSPSDSSMYTFSGSLFGGNDSLSQPTASGTSLEHLTSSFPSLHQATSDRIMQLTNILTKNFSDSGQSSVPSTNSHMLMSTETSKSTPIPITFHTQKNTLRPLPSHTPTTSRATITNQPIMTTSPVTSLPWALPHSLNMKTTTKTTFPSPSTITSDITGQTPSILNTGQSATEAESLLPLDEIQVEKPHLASDFQVF
ncbi:mucin-17-like [Penaeus monodon]|uniref:mucin-17-like n=1 Tax=Penaeus monodon TaxID=6687 RepID=UPI0018A76D1C|nr:mucin-17-like [Penaeus monodon]